MSAEVKRSYGLTFVLFTLGVLAVYGGTRWLLILIPAALIAWYAAGGSRSVRSRN